MGLDAAAVGNHDFDEGEPALKTLVDAARFPVLGANVVSHGEIGAVRASVVRTVGGVKIGILGLLTSGMGTLEEPENTAGVEFRPEAAAAKAAVAELRAQGAALIVAATHLGVERYGGKDYNVRFGDIALAQAVPDLRIILGGHTHVDMKEPLFVTTPDGGKTLITQTRGSLSSVYRVALTVARRTGAVRKVDAKLIPLEGIAPDPAIAAIVARGKDRVRDQMSRPVGTASAAIEKDGTIESSIGEWVADAERAYAGADVGAMNTFGVRAGLRAGPLTYGDVYEVCPFDGAIVTVRLTGAELRKLVEKTLTPDTVFLQYSGLEAAYDPAGPAGARLRSLLVGGAPVDDARTYTVAAPAFVVRLSPSFAGATMSVGPKSELILRDIVAEKVRASSPVAPPAHGRVRKL